MGATDPSVGGERTTLVGLHAMEGEAGAGSPGRCRETGNAINGVFMEYLEQASKRGG